MRGRTGRRIGLAAVVVALIVPTTPRAGASDDVQSAPAAPMAAAPVPAAPGPGSAELEGLLPPGARQLLSGVRIFSAMGARNRVYREAGSVQSELRTYYEDRIATAQQQLLDRVQLGLEPSQLRAYIRVKAKLEAELAAALDDTEFEKRAAKYGFESVFKREMTAALVRVPRIRAGLENMRSAVEDLQATIGSVQTAIESGNPIGAVTAELDEKLGKVERFGAAMAVINGRAGERILTVTQRIRDTVAPVQDTIDEAAGAAGQAIGELEDLRGAINEQLDAPRSPRAGLDVLVEDAPIVDRIAAATGAKPAVDAIAGVIARQATRQSGGDGGAQVELARMRDRVRAAVLGRTLERIEGLCGQLVGALRRAALEAAAAGTPPPDQSSPCTTYGDPAALQALIDAERAASAAQSATTTEPEAPAATLAPAGSDAPSVAAGAWALTFTGSTEVDGAVLSSDWTATIEIGPDGAVTGSGDGATGLSGPCTAGIDGEPGDEVLSQIDAIFSHSIEISGQATGGEGEQTLTFDYTATDLVLTSYSESGDQPCRELLESQVGVFADFMGGSVTIAAADGATATSSATVPGTVTLTAP